MQHQYSIHIALICLACIAQAAIEPFSLSDVRISDSSFQARHAKMNEKYLLDMLSIDRLMWVFRQNAGLPTPDAPYIGSWEDPNCQLRGHFVGHYLTALSLAWSSTGDARFFDRLESMVGELGKVQDAMGTGYLSAFPDSAFDTLEDLKEWIWAPYYTIHKIMAGMLDAYELGGIQRALNITARMAAYHIQRTDDYIRERGLKAWLSTLEIEFGGMNEVMYRLYRLTKDPDHLRFGDMFIKPWFIDGLALGKNMLPRLHANTHLAQVVGFAESYETRKDGKSRQAVSNFYDIVMKHYSFATGGSSWGERWQAPDELAKTVWEARDATMTQETCTQYNILKIARYLFKWTGNVSYADHYERALLNGILGTARLPEDDWADESSEDLLPGSADARSDAGKGPGAVRHHHHHHHHMGRAVRGSFAEQKPAAGEVPGVEVVEPGSLISPKRRYHNDEWMDWIAFSRPKPEWNTSDAHGAGVLLYYTVLGTGMSKSDNLHHWGFPFHSFWCCYGTIIESYAKFGDSIFFKDLAPAAASHGGGSTSSGTKLPPRLYVNQMVASRLSFWLGLSVWMEADMHAPGPAANVSIKLAAVANASTVATANEEHSSIFTLMIRIPKWTIQGRVVITVNGLLWRQCPGMPMPETYCEITRTWAAGDSVSISLPMQWWTMALPEHRKGYQGLTALLMGPFMMVGISHGENTLQVPVSGVDLNSHADTHEKAASMASINGFGLPSGLVAYQPEEADELLSLQASWNNTLFLRHNSYHAFISVVEDGGDAMDATFRLGRACHHGAKHGTAGGLEPPTSNIMTDASSTQASGMDSKLKSVRAHMRMGMQHEAGQHISLEAMNYPNMFLAADEDGYIVLKPGHAAAAYTAARGSRDISSRIGASGGSTPSCWGAEWMMKPGLDGRLGSMSFEAVHKPGHFLSAAHAAAADGPLPCHDHHLDGDCGKEHEPLCNSASYQSLVLCRKSCGACPHAAGALRLLVQRVGDAAYAASTSFFVDAPQRSAYPLGSHIVAGSNRAYLVAPLGHLVDERYAAHFLIESTAPRTA